MSRALVIFSIFWVGCVADEVPATDASPWRMASGNAERSQTLRDECAEWMFEMSELPGEEPSHFVWTLKLENICETAMVLRTVDQLGPEYGDENNRVLRMWAYDGVGGHFISRTVSGEPHMASCRLLAKRPANMETVWAGFETIEYHLQPDEVLQWTHEFTAGNWLQPRCASRLDYDANVSLSLPRLSTELPSTPFKVCDQMDENRYGWTVTREHDLALSDQLVVWPLGAISPEPPEGRCYMEPEQ